MKSFFALLGLAGLVATSPQAVTFAIYPPSTSPYGCNPSYPGQFQISVTNITPGFKRSAKKSSCGGEGSLTLTLSEGVLKDAQSRTGYIASNYQFQFDSPPQSGAIYTAGFSICDNSSLALGDSTIFYQCLSGNFYNLYDRHWAAQCSPVHIEAISCSTSSLGEIQVTGSQGPGGQLAGDLTPNPFSEPFSGRPELSAPMQAASVAQVVSQISDGQPQVHTAVVPTAVFPSSIAPHVSGSQPQAVPTLQPTRIAPPKSGGQPQIIPAPQSTRIAPPKSGNQSPVIPAPSYPAQDSPQISHGTSLFHTGVAPTTFAPSDIFSQTADRLPPGGSQVSPSTSLQSIVSQISDGQPQVISIAPQPTGTVPDISSGQPPVISMSPQPTQLVSQTTDGHPQIHPTVVPTTTSQNKIVPQMSYGLVEAPTVIGNNDSYFATNFFPHTGSASTWTIANSFVGLIVGALAATFL